MGRQNEGESKRQESSKTRNVERSLRVAIIDSWNNVECPDINVWATALSIKHCFATSQAMLPRSFSQEYEYQDLTIFQELKIFRFHLYTSSFVSFALCTSQAPASEELESEGISKLSTSSFLPFCSRVTLKCLFAFLVWNYVNLW